MAGPPAGRPLAGQVQTVLGPIPADALGVTLPHEHLLLDLRFTHRQPRYAPARARALEPVGLPNLYEISYDWFSNLDNLHLSDQGEAIAEALAYRQAGGQGLADPTCVGLARDPLALQRIARATGLHIVMGAGYYTGPAHPPDMDARSEDTLTAEIVEDVTRGVGATRVRAGLVGEIGCSWPWTPNEQKSLRTAARAARETGAPLMIHPGRDPDAPLAHLDQVRRLGLPLSRVILCHVERTIFDRNRLKALADTGCFIEYDLFGVEVSRFPWGGPDMPNDTERMRQILWLWEQGHGRQVLMSHDVCFKIRLTRYGGTGLVHILRRIVPRLRDRGLTEADVRTLIVDNPARALAFV